MSRCVPTHAMLLCMRAQLLLLPAEDAASYRILEQHLAEVVRCERHSSIHSKHTHRSKNMTRNTENRQRIVMSTALLCLL
jgi:hypothetical protein